MSEFAVVGVGCELPGARSADELWENVLAVRRAFRRLPDVRLNAKDYYSDDHGDADRTYLTRAAVIEGYAFDRVKYRISKSTYEQTDLAHWLALDVTARALDDAGFAGGEGLPKQRTGVVIGNSLAGEFSRANIMRLRWPYVRRVVDAVLKRRGDSVEARETLLGEVQQLYKAPFPVPDADMLAGGLANTIAGRITNYFDFGGGCYTVDGACSSSLLAVVEGCRALQEGMWDVAIVGGVDLSIDPFEVIGFTRNGALARSDMRSFDARSEGFWPGEGAGVAILMRKAEAVSRGLPIYAVVRGWGMSSDGSGGITRPSAQQQTLAMRRCYEMAGYPISDVGYFEAHGTGTRVGDEIELQAVVAALREAGRGNDKIIPAIGSVKELIGHTKAAAGISGFLKACLSARQGIVPPGRATDSPHPVLEENAGVLKRAQRPELWAADRPLRVGVSGMGFGGINVHLTLEEAGRKSRRRAFTTRERRLVQSQRDAELFPFAATTSEQLLSRLRELRPRVPDLSFGELGDLSAMLCRAPSRGQLRLCFVARDADQLARQIDSVVTALEQGAEPPAVSTHGTFFNNGRTPRKIGLLFPGQGAPSRRNAGAAEFLAGDCSDLYAAVPWDHDPEGTHTSTAQPAIMASSLAGLRLLEGLNVQASVAVGHSLGEIAAMVWGQSLSEPEAMRLSSARGMIMADHGRPDGGMLALGCSAETVRSLLGDASCEVAAYNGASAVVVAGDRAELQRIQRRAEAADLAATPLRVSHAFHSVHMLSAQAPFRDVLQTTAFEAPARDVFSTTAGRLLTADDDLRELLASQLVKPVLFAHAIDSNAAVDLWIEVGPGDVLRRTMRSVATPVVSMEIGSSSVEGVLKALAAAYALGAVESLDALSEERVARELNLAKPLTFFRNPCETVAESDARDVPAKAATEDVVIAPAPAAEKGPESTPAGLTEMLRRLVSEASEIPLAAVGAADRVLSDLHLNSLVIQEILAKIGRIFAPGDRQFAKASMKAFRDSSLSDLAQHLYEVVKESGSTSGQRGPSALNVDELPVWVNVFANGAEALPRAQPVVNVGADDSWTTFGDSDPLARELGAALAHDDLTVGRGVAVIVGRDSGAKGVEAFLAAANAVRASDGVQHFVLVQLESSESIDSLAPGMRTFCLEQPGKRCTVVHLDEWLPGAARAVKTEASLCERYHEVTIARDGTRTRPVLKPVFLETRRRTPRIGSSDVFLVPGGGKGITFESARRIAEYSGARLGLFGRATPSTDALLTRNLQALTEAGIQFHYVAADVTDKEAVGRAVAAIERTLGTVTAVLYGAGANKPALIHDQTVDKWAHTRSMKIEGLENTVAALPGRPLKALITYGSIIAQSGLDGEFDYALANEELARFTAAYGVRHPDRLALCLEWSVWSGVGMGESLDIIDRLKSTGVSPIGIEQGLDTLERALESDLELPSRLTVCSRYGALPTFSIARAPARDAFRFNEKTISQFPGIELVSEAVLSVASDPYLDDHVYRGQRVFPAVMAFEAMAQHAAALVPQTGRVTIENAVFESPIIVPKDGTVRIRVAASRVGERRFIATIRSETSDFAVDCFRAVLLVEPGRQGAIAPWTLPANGHLVDMDIDRDFYDAVLFHTGQFRTIRRFFAIHQNGSRAAIELAEPRRWFGGALPQRLVLGHPGLNDAAAHCHQGSVPQYSLLPASVERVVFNEPARIGHFRIGTTERSISQNHVTIDVEIVDGAGRLVQRWESLTFRRVDGSDFDGPWPVPLLNAYIEHAVENLLGIEGFHSSLEPESAAGGLRLAAPAHQVTGAVLPVRRDDPEGPLENAEGLRRLLNRARFGLHGEQLTRIDVLDDLMKRADRVEQKSDGWLAVSTSDATGSGDTTIARIFELNTGESALAVLTAGTCSGRQESQPPRSGAVIDAVLTS
jgi:enediyne polyketide synthase